MCIFVALKQIVKRKLDSNGPPVLYTETPTLPLQKLFPLGQEVLVNARKVRSDLVSLQATVVFVATVLVTPAHWWPLSTSADRARPLLHKDEQ